MARRKARKVGLPEEIIVDILIQLPPKCIGQFRCVSKQWCSLLSDPKFLKAHHNIHAHKQQQTKLIFISPSHSLHTITFKPQNEYYLVGISRKLNFHQLSNKWHIIVGSCNGLVLVVDKQYIKFLINPTTLKYHQIPNFELAPPKPDEYGMCGLGYDSATDDYKIVALSRSYTSGVKTTFVDIYSVKKGFWRRLESSGFDDTHYPLIASGLLLNGALHWVADKTNCCRSVIVAFDLSGETFLELRTPECYEGVEFLHNLVVLRGCLCMVTDSEENKLDVLMMKDYGVEESWTKFSFTIPEMFIRPLPMCLTSEDDVVLNVVDGGKLIVYNIKEDQWWYMMVDEINLKYKSAGILIDSLVSPTFGKGTEGYFIA